MPLAEISIWLRAHLPNLEIFTVEVSDDTFAHQTHHKAPFSPSSSLYIYLPWTLVDLIHCHYLISKAEIITAFGAGQKLVLSYTSPINLPQGSALASSSTICWRYEKRVKVCWSNARATPECHHLASRSHSDLKWPVGNVTQHSHQLYCHHLHCTSLCCSGDPTQCNPVYCNGFKPTNEQQFATTMAYSAPKMLSSSKNVIALRSFINSSLLHTFFSSSWICMSVLQSSTVSCRGLVLENQYQLNNGWGHLNDQAIYHYISCRIPSHRNLEKISFSSVFKWKILKNLSLNIDSTLPLHFTLILDRTFINQLGI